LSLSKLDGREILTVPLVDIFPKLIFDSFGIAELQEEAEAFLYYIAILLLVISLLYPKLKVRSV
jgi:hypothetical protein